MTDKTDWRTQATELQMQYYETLGSRPYDEIDKANLFLLKKKVGFATCGKPCELPSSSNYNTGYKKEDLDQIKTICDKIIEKSDCNPVKFACTVLILNYQDACCESPVFRVVTDSGNIFIDANARVYLNWEHFMNNNKLPDCEYCYPFNGEYTIYDQNAEPNFDQNAKLEYRIAFALSPSSSLMSKTTDCLDTVGSIACIGAGSVFMVGTFCTVAPLVATVAGGTALCTGAYSVVRGASTLYDRTQHEQTIAVNDREARSAWMSIGSSALGVATIAALGKAKNIYESGKSLGKLATFSLHTLTATSVAFSGFGFVETLLLCSDKYKKGVLTKQDVFDLSCELMFLFNAIASAKATTNFVNSMSNIAETPAAQKKLTKTQKRNMRKRAAKRRAKGIATSVTEDTQGIRVGTAVQLLIFEAVKAYAPRIEDIHFTCQSIGHDIQSWKAKEISEMTLMKNLLCNCVHLYNTYRSEIEEVTTKIIKYFSSAFDKIKKYIYELFQNCSNEVKSLFCTKVINMEDQLDVLINDAERDILNLYESLEIQNVEMDHATDNSIPEDYERCDGDELNAEAQDFLSICMEVITQTSWSFDDIQEFCDILECIKHVAVNDFKVKVSNYKQSLEAAKSASGDSFNINIFHSKLGIKDDVEQHMFKDTLKDLTVESAVFRMKKKCKELKKERNVRTTPVWEALTERMFHYYGPHGQGDLPKSQLLPIISSVIRKNLTEESISWTEEVDKDIVLVQINDDTETVIVVYNGITEENTASGVIMVVK